MPFFRGPRWLAAAFLLAFAAACSDGGPAAPDAQLEAKLERQFERYGRLQDLVAERHRDTAVPLELRLIARDEWERRLAAPPDEAFTDEDLARLRERQARRVAAERERAIRLSTIDFAAWRALPPAEGDRRIREFCDAVPKGGMLHIHPWGTLTPQTYRALLERANPVIPAARLAAELADPSGRAFLYPDELAWLRGLPAEAHFLSLHPDDRARFASLAALPPGVHSFPRFEAVFNLLGFALGDDAAVDRALDEFASRAVRGGVTYVEFTESLYPDELARTLAVAQRLEAVHGLAVRFNNAFSRAATPAAQDARVRTMLREMASPVIAGIDLLAYEDGTPALEKGQAVYGPVLAAVRYGGAPWRRTMHAGEHGDARNPRDALLLGAERLGHGVQLARDPVTLEYAARRGIPVEVNLTSNLRLGAVADIRDHPFLTYLRLGLPVSLSTDDEGIFGADIVGECVLAVGRTDVTYHEYREMAFNALRASFAAPALRDRLLDDLAARFARFEAR